MIVTGIGSRETPHNIIGDMMIIGDWCRQRNILVRSGHAAGADYAFECGAQECCTAYIPWAGFAKDLVSRANLVVPTFTKEIEAIASKFHPAWPKLSYGARKLHMRNVCQVLGQNLDAPSNVVVCYTKDGKASGGTGQAIRIANHYNIPVINMYSEKLDAVLSRLSALHSA